MIVSIKTGTRPYVILNYMRFNRDMEFLVSDFVRPSDHFVGYSASSLMWFLKKHWLIEVTWKQKTQWQRGKYLNKYRVTQKWLDYVYGTLINWDQQTKIKYTDIWWAKINTSTGKEEIWIKPSYFNSLLKLVWIK